MLAGPHDPTTSSLKTTHLLICYARVMSQHNVIYIPGLGDHRSWGQEFILKFWRLTGIKVHYQSISWAKDEAFGKKLDRPIQKIDELASNDRKVSLVGVSAGASAALNAYSARPSKTKAVVFICGKLHNPQTVNPRYYIENPAFQKSLALAQANIAKLTAADKAKMLSVWSPRDRLVPPRDSQIPGIKNHRLRAGGHIPSILAALTIYRLLITDFIKSRGSI